MSYIFQQTLSLVSCSCLEIFLYRNRNSIAYNPLSETLHKQRKSALNLHNYSLSLYSKQQDIFLLTEEMPLLAMSYFDHAGSLRRINSLRWCTAQPTCSSMNYLNDAVTQSKNKKLHYSSSTEYAVDFFITTSFEDDGFSTMTQFFFRSYTNTISQYSLFQNGACQKYQTVSQLVVRKIFGCIHP